MASLSDHQGESVKLSQPLRAFSQSYSECSAQATEQDPVEIPFPAVSVSAHQNSYGKVSGI